MKIFSKILVPIDFEPHSSHALRLAMDLARPFEAEVILLHVYQPEQYPLTTTSIVYDEHQLLRMTTDVRSRLEAARRDVGASRLVSARVVQGETTPAIVDFARSEGVDLIVMGTHGRTGLDRLVMGSVSAQVTRKAPCGVLTVKERVPQLQPIPTKTSLLARWWSIPFGAKTPSPVVVPLAATPESPHALSSEHLPVHH